MTSRGVLGTRPRDIDQVLGTLGIDGYVRDGELSTCCPLHNERRPSFGINMETGLWFCHAGCGGGTLAWLVARVSGVRPRQAERWLSGLRLTERPDDDEWNPLQDAWYDEERLFRSFPAPPEYALEDRGISAEAASALSIRWDRRAADRISADGWWHMEELGGWILPIRHPGTSNILGWQTKLIADVDGGTHTQPRTPKSRTLFGIEVFKPGTTAILVESPLDVAVLRTARCHGGLASFGASVSRYQRKLLADRASRIVLALDNDEAGKESRHKLIKAPELADKELFRFNYAHVPDAKDVGDMTNNEIREGLRTAKQINK